MFDDPHISWFYNLKYYDLKLRYNQFDFSSAWGGKKTHAHEAYKKISDML